MWRKKIPQITDSDSVDAEYPEQPNRKRKLAQEEDTPEEPNMKRKLAEDEHSAGSKRSEGPASFMSRSAAYKKLFMQVFDLYQAARQEMLDVSTLEPHISKILCWNPIDRLFLRTIKNGLEMLLGDNYFSHDEESTDLLETDDDDDDGNDNSTNSESTESSEPSDDFPKFISSSQERDEDNPRNTSHEGEGSFQTTDDSNIQNDTKTNLDFSIKKELAKCVKHKD